MSAWNNFKYRRVIHLHVVKIYLDTMQRLYKLKTVLNNRKSSQTKEIHFQ